MHKNLLAIAIGIGFVLLFGVGETTINNLSVQNADEQSAAIFRSSKSNSSLGFGNLCSSLTNCFVFCKSNVGRCQNYCKRNPRHEFCKLLPAAKPQPWKPNAITQPLPEGASKIRLVLPAPLEAMPLDQIGAFGAHRWGHTEGLDHEWISIKKEEPVRSWADGEVVSARLEPGYGPGEYSVVIYYGDGLWGEHMHVKTPLVKEGQRVKAGDPVAYGKESKSPNYHIGEFNLVDQHRRGGVETWHKFVKGGIFVSPFDYLRADVKKALEERWQKEIVERLPRLSDFNEITPTPWEPYLTNPLLFHKDHRGELVGEWFLRSKLWAQDDAPDILILLPVQSPYYPKQRVIAVDDSAGPNDFHGDWTADYAQKRLILETDRGTFYGVFELDELGSQAALKLEYQKDDYPTAFSSRMLRYTERDFISKTEEVHYWRNPQYDPRRW